MRRGVIIAMSRHADRQKAARVFGATDIVTERGDEGIARIKGLTNGLGAHSAVEAGLPGDGRAPCRQGPAPPLTAGPLRVHVRSGTMST
ncbi:hypothetical protein Aab01nite_60700 [Paractinoplanes abujensis]|nr:hypothetical protein Aab01nite_60700 [Actinoplanes abujensis]